MTDAPNTTLKFNHILQTVYQVLFSLSIESNFPRQSYGIVFTRKSNYI